MIAVGIIVVISAVVVFTLNPSTLLANFRDSKRSKDVISAHKAINFIEGWDVDSLSYGDPTKVYISIPSDFSDCSDIVDDLPDLNDGFNYACSNESNYTKTDGNGWLPIDFELENTSYYLTSLPIDPINDTNHFYSYFASDGYEIMSILENSTDETTVSESERNDIFLLGSPNRQSHIPIILSSSETSLPEDLDSLVMHWLFDGEGTDVPDHSGNGNKGTLKRVGQREQLASGKYVAYYRLESDYDRIRGYYNDGEDWVQNYDMSSWDEVTLISWARINSEGGSFDQVIFGELNRYGPEGFINLHRISGSSTSLRLRYTKGTSSNYEYEVTENFFNDFDDQWLHIAITIDFVSAEYKTYRNGVLFSEHTLTTPVRPANTKKCIGCEHITSSVRTLKDGYMGEFQLHNGLVSEESLLEHYNETKSDYGY